MKKSPTGKGPSRPAFTIVELIVAIALVSVLLAVAVPRYNAYGQTQQFASSLVDIATCVQSAQSAAAAPSEALQGSLAFSEAVVSYGSTELPPNSPTNRATSCRTYLYTKDATFDTTTGAFTGPAVSQTDVKDIVSVPYSIPCSVVGTGTDSVTTAQPLVIRIRFAVLARGVPSALSATALAGSSTPVAPNFGSGLTMSLYIAPIADLPDDATCSAAPIGLKTIYMGRLGLPIQVR